MSTRSSSLRDYQRAVVPIVGAGVALPNAALIIYFDRVGIYTELGGLEPSLTAIATAVFVTSAVATAAMLLRSRVGHNLRLLIALVHALVIGATGMLVGELATAPASIGSSAATTVTFMWLGAFVVLGGIASTLIRTGSA